MDMQAMRGVRSGPIGLAIVVVAIVSVVVVALATALAVAIFQPAPVGSILAGPAWQWTGTTADPALAPRVIADPSIYTVEFRQDLTFLAKADCTTVSGTYRRVLAGRTGFSSTGLRLKPEPFDPASCGPGSLSVAFLSGLLTASRYSIADDRLTLYLPTPGTMTFELPPGSKVP